MTSFPTEFTRALAVDIAGYGLGFALLEGPLALIDWEFFNARDDRDAQCVTYLVSMLTKFTPDVLVIEDFKDNKRRSDRVKKLADVFTEAAKEHGIVCRRISRKAVKSRFPSCRNKYDIAAALADRFPEIRPACPPKRKSWKSEDSRINIFDALSIGFTYMTSANKKDGHDRKNSTTDNKAAPEQNRCDTSFRDYAVSGNIYRLFFLPEISRVISSPLERSYT